MAHQKDVAKKITVDLEQQLREREDAKARLKKEEEVRKGDVGWGCNTLGMQLGRVGYSRGHSNSVPCKQR